MGYWTNTVEEIGPECPNPELVGRFYIMATERCYEDGGLSDIDEPGKSAGRTFATRRDAVDFARAVGIRLPLEELSTAWMYEQDSQ